MHPTTVRRPACQKQIATRAPMKQISHKERALLDHKKRELIAHQKTELIEHKPEKDKEEEEEK